MAIARTAALCIGSIALLGALVSVCWATYFLVLSPCYIGVAECVGSAATLFLLAVVLLIFGILLVAIGRSYGPNSN